MKALFCVLMLATICMAQSLVDCGQCTTVVLSREEDNRAIFSVLKTGRIEVQTPDDVHICISPTVPYRCLGSGWGYVSAWISGLIDTTFISLWSPSAHRLTMCIGCGDRQLPVEDDSVEVPEQEEEEDPSPYLSEVTMQAYPNLSGACVEFDMPEAGQVQLWLLNILGQKVKIIANGNFSAGIHRLSLSGSPHSTGTYFVRGSFFEGASVITRMVSFVK